MIRRPPETPLFDALDRLQRDAHRLTHPYGQIFVGKPVGPAERRDNGIQRAVAHAEKETERWAQRATMYLTDLIDRRGFKPFLFEELIEIAIREGVAAPPDGRAWGGIARRLAKAGVIRNLGYAPAKTSNLSPKVLWGKTVPERAEQHEHD